MPQKRVGILTYHHVINEGAMLQAYALLSKVKEYFSGYTVEIIDYRPLSTEKRYLWCTVFGSKNPKRMIKGLRRYIIFKAAAKKYLNMSNRKLITDNYSKALNFLKGKFDIIIVGSDEIWKIEKGRPFPNIYWLSADLSCKKAAFAASAHKLAYKELDADVRNWIREKLLDFSLIGARDNHTMEMIKHMGAFNSASVTRVPDPTFMLDVITFDIKEYLKKNGVNFNKKLLGITFYDKGMNRGFFKHFRDRGYQIISLTASNKFADVDLSDKLDPLQWACVFKYFSLCITNLFHGTIFCLKNKVPFVAVDFYFNHVYQSKLQCLLSEFGITKRHAAAKEGLIDCDLIIKKAEAALDTSDFTDLNDQLSKRKFEAENFVKKIRDYIDDKAV